MYNKYSNKGIKIINIKFRGVRGSRAVAGASFKRFGCASTCCELQVAGRRLIFDAGSGIIPLGNEILKSKNKAFSLFFTHFHHDHFYGMNYFKPLYDKNCEAVFIGSTYGKGSLKKIWSMLRMSWFSR